MSDDPKETVEIVMRMTSFLAPSLNETQRRSLSAELSVFGEKEPVLKNYDKRHTLDLEIFVESHIFDLNQAQKAEIVWMIWAWRSKISKQMRKRGYRGRFEKDITQERGAPPHKYALSLIPVSHHVLSEIRKIKRIMEQNPLVQRAWDAALAGKRTVASVTKIVRGLEKQKYISKSEQKLEEILAHAFDNYGVKNLQRQVYLPSGGMVDLMMDGVLCEIKHVLTRNILYKAVGQILLYATELDRRDNKLVIYGYPTWESQKLEPLVNKLGIKIIFHEDEEEDS